MGQISSFFVRVDGKGPSLYRSPEGVYQVSVPQGDNSERMMARAILDGAEEAIPFLRECSSLCTLRLFSSAGHEISIAGLPSGCEDLVIVSCERVRAYPESILEH